MKPIGIGRTYNIFAAGHNSGFNKIAWHGKVYGNVVNGGVDSNIKVQILLNKCIRQLSPARALQADGSCGPLTVGAILEFHRRIMGIKKPNGRIDPGGNTLKQLNTMAEPGKSCTLTRHSQQRNSIGVLVLWLLFSLGAMSCNKGSEQIAPPENAITSTEIKIQTDAVFSYVDVKEKITSSSSPLGYWEKNLHYPQINMTSNAQEIMVINESLVQLINKYRCDTEGDQSFEAEVTLANTVLISFKYDAMWLCDSMPRPDSTSGAAAYDLDTGAEIKLADEMLDKASVDKLRSMVLSKFTKLVNEKNQQGANCPPPAPSNIFYLNDRTMLFRAVYADHSDSACEVEVAVAWVEIKNLFKSSGKLHQALQ